MSLTVKQQMEANSKAWHTADASNEAVKWIDKAPKGFTWQSALVQKDGGYTYNKLSFKEHGDDLYVRFQGNNLKQKIVAIKDFRNVRATDLFNMEGQPFDTGHFNDGILKIWDQNDLGFGYVEKITKPIAKPIESSENKADNEV